MTTNPNPDLAAKADQIATDIERLAAFLRANPDIAAELCGETFRIFLIPHDGVAAQMADFARRARRAGAVMTKNVSDDYASAELAFGDIRLDIYTHREVVCERIIVATREETVEEPDPEALAALPKVKRTQVVEDVRWECRPLLEAEAETRNESATVAQKAQVA
jgi:hypothetical protein